MVDHVVTSLGVVPVIRLFGCEFVECVNHVFTDVRVPVPNCKQRWCDGGDSLRVRPAEVCWMKRCSNPTLKFFISGTLFTTSSCELKSCHS